jgi:hypothetical protein
VTERLADLMHRAVDDLRVPPAPSAEVLRHGRAVRRHRGYAVAAGAVATVVVVSGIAVATTNGDNEGDGKGKDRQPQVADIAGGLTGPVFSIGTTVYLDGGTGTATIDDKAIKSMYYTSAGVVVRHGNNNYSDGGGPMRFSLVAPDGAVSPIDVTFEETVPSTDPDQPYLAYAEKVDDVVQVVVLDVRDGSEAARVPVPDAKKWGGWEAPPVSLDGDLVYVGTDDVQRVVDWRTGEVTTSDAVGPGFPVVRDGHAVTSSDRSSAVIDVSTGSILAQGKKDEYFSLSPDGRYALGQTYDFKDPRARLVDLASGSEVALDIQGNGLGWAPDDSVFALTGSDLTSCRADTGACTTTSLSLPVVPDSNQSDQSFDDDLRLGGMTYES